MMNRVGLFGGVCLVLAATGVIFIKTEALEEECVRFREVNFPGGNIGDPFPDTTNAECCELCKLEPKCFAWTRFNGGGCQLKDGTRGEATVCDFCSFSGLILSRQEFVPEKKCVLIPESRLAGGDVSFPVRTDSDEACCELCKQEPICVAWTRMKESGRCRLKTSINLDGLKCPKCSASGVMLSPRQESVKFPGIEFNGGDMSEASSTASDVECSDRCLRNPNCKLWTRSNSGDCSLKNFQTSPTVCGDCSSSGFIQRRQSPVDADKLRADLKRLVLPEEPHSIKVVVNNFLLSTAEE